MKSSKKVDLEEIVGKKIKEIKSGSEILLLKEIDKHLKKEGKCLNMTGIGIVEELKYGEYLSYVTRNSDIQFDFEVSEDKLLKYSVNAARKYFKGDLEGIVLEKQTDDEWVYSYYTNPSRNIILNRVTRSTAYIDLVAYMIVEAYKKGKKVPKLKLKNGGTSLQQELEYLDILIVKNLGNKILDGVVEIEYAKELSVQPEWEAYVYYNRQRGQMVRESSIIEKRNYTKSKYKEGDVVLYYRTEESSDTKSIKKLISCYPAVIRLVGDMYIEFDYYPLIEIKENYVRRLREIEKKMGYGIYGPEDYDKFIEVRERIGYEDIGINEKTYNENHMLIEMLDGVDTFKQTIKTGSGRLIEEVFSTSELVYAVFEDRGVKYNKEKYKEKNFGKREPKYDRIKRQ